MLRYDPIFLKLSFNGKKVKKAEFALRGKGKPVTWGVLARYQLDLSQFSTFERAVFRAVRKIPPGKVSTYKEVAKDTGAVNASRAVGNALAKNPLPIFVPCHRVVKSDLSLGGFSYSRRMKKRILEAEGVEFAGKKVKTKFLLRSHL